MQDSKCKCLSTEGVLLTLSAGKAASADLYVLFCMCAISSCITEISRKKDKPVWPPISCSCCDNVVSNVPKTINCDSRPLASHERLKKQPLTSAYNFYYKSITWTKKSLGRQLRPPLCVFTRNAEQCNRLTVKRKEKLTVIFKVRCPVDIYTYVLLWWLTKCDKCIMGKLIVCICSVDIRTCGMESGESCVFRIN